ncbi:ABC transporter permease [Micromonospora sp. WMMD723]|uniref:ABC transporter permease n=1 Tax=unclassified Micromonospora TaxID=2617518 RepID=UPI003B952853
MNRRTSVRFLDLMSEALAGLLQRPGRSVLTALGAVLGITSLVSVLGLAATAGAQIDDHFSELAATTITVEDIGRAGEISSPPSFLPDAPEKIARLNGVTAAGVWWPVPNERYHLAAAPGVRNDTNVGVMAADSGALAAAEIKLRSGRIFDTFHEERAERVAILGAAAADRLGISTLAYQPTVFINDMPFSVMAVVDSVERLPELLLSVIIPPNSAVVAFGTPEEPRARMLVETRAGAISLVASQIALALRPEAPEMFKVVAAGDPQSLRAKVTGDLDDMIIVLAVVCLVIGAVGIANTMLVSVLERVEEIGLRRTLGARPWHIGVQFIAESAVLGATGGLIGTALGVSLVLAIAIARRWTAVIEPWTVALAPCLGLAIGLSAGLYPARRAARIEPADAMRR